MVTFDLKINIEQLWYSKNILSIFLLPLSWLFRGASFLRRSFYNSFASKPKPGSASVIVVGNLTVGGAGKTPFVAYLAQCCLDKKLNVGVVSRGYGRKNENTLVDVLNDSDVAEVGDEALMLKQNIACPVVVAAERKEAVKYLNEKYDLDVIISDDGLQHYKLARDYEIVIVDGEREFGNGRCLPAGPLREPVSRLEKADIVISNGENSNYEYQYTTSFKQALSLVDRSQGKSLEEFKHSSVHAVAGIGYPQRFFRQLEKAGIPVISHAFPDHHAYSSTDLEFNDNLPILMTEKDAVKCKHFYNENAWYLPITAMPNDKLTQRITTLVEEMT